MMEQIVKEMGKHKNVVVRDMQGQKLYEGLDYKIENGTLIPLHDITIKEITCIKEPPKPNREQRRHGVTPC